jgi:hypothetical protein
MYIPARQPCTISSLPCLLEVMKITSAPKFSHVSLRSCIVSGRLPRFFESQRIILSGSICLWIRPVIVGPKVLSWSEPIQMRNLAELQKRIQKKMFESGVPVWALDAGGQRCPNTGSGADADSSLKQGGCMPNTSYCILVDNSFGDNRTSIPNFSSLVHTDLGGSITRLFVKSP